MAWTAPVTAASNSTLTAATWNSNVRDNFNMTEAATVTAGGYYVVSTGANALTPHYPYGWNRGAITVTSTSFVKTHSGFDVGHTWTYAGQALVLFRARVRHDTANAQTVIGAGLDGAAPASNADCLVFDGIGALHYWQMSGFFMTSVTAAAHSWELWAKTSTGSVDITNFNLTVLPF